MRYLYVLVMLSALVWLAGCGGSSGQSIGRGTIRGIISETTQAALTRAAGDAITVRVEGTNLSTATSWGNEFVIENVPTGMHTLVASTNSRAAAIVVEVVSGQETNIGLLPLQDAGQIAGIVTDKTSGDPVVGADVTVTEAVSAAAAADVPCSVRITSTDMHGSYLVDSLPAGSYLVTVTKAGYSAATMMLEVQADATTPGDVTLTAIDPGSLGSVQGTVYLKLDDGALRPLEGVLVRLVPPGYASDPTVTDVVPNMGGSTDPPEYMGYYAFTDADGHYLITGVPPGDYAAVAGRFGMPPGNQPVTVRAGETATADLTLEMPVIEFGTITGTVTSSATGEPLANAEVVAIISFVDPIPLTGSGGGSAKPGVIATPGSTDCQMFTLTDADGRYELRVPTGVSAIGVRLPGYVPALADVAVAAGETQTVDIALDPVTDQPVTLSGHVYTESAAGQPTPVGGATVYAQPAGPITIMMPAMIYSAETATDGSYTLSLPAGEYVGYAIKADQELLSDFLMLSLYADTQQDFLLQKGVQPPMPMVRKVRK